MIPDERRIGVCINTIFRKYLGADRLHPFYAISVQHRYFTASSDTGLPGKIIDRAAILFQGAIYRNMVVSACARCRW